MEIKKGGEMKQIFTFLCVMVTIFFHVPMFAGENKLSDIVSIIDFNKPYTFLLNFDTKDATAAVHFCKLIEGNSELKCRMKAGGHVHKLEYAHADITVTGKIQSETLINLIDNAVDKFSSKGEVNINVKQKH